MKNIVGGIIAFIIIGCVACSGGKRSGAPKVLVFSKTAGFYHQSIPDGIAAIQKLGSENGFQVDTTKNADLFTEKNLGQYAAVIFLSTTGDVLNNNQEAAFERYIQSGGGYAGIHAATDTEYKWSWYGRLVGAYFQSHPQIQQADFIVKDNTHPSTAHLELGPWNRKDELYNFKNISKDINVLITIDESTYEGGENGDNHPMSWYHEFDGGRAWYTAAGHTSESFEEDEFLKHLLGGIHYAIGDNLKLDYRKATTALSPDGDRFSKRTLAVGDFTEPTEMTILPNHDALIAQRRGEIWHWDAKYEELNEVAKLDVYWKTNVPGVNAEEGLMGLQKDPNYAENHWVYCFYAPAGSEEINRLSRFKFMDGVFDIESEQVILDVASDRQICCHTGGSIAFGPDDLLYLSTGDNTTPFDKPGAKYVNNGYAPLNDLPGDKQYDARRSSGNTNDLRGKILRIKVQEDGSYTIPEGNLFPVGTPKTRPEIYTMGHRNPYRISVDKKNGYVYWGEVGPDANEDALDTRGPMGYDEMNQAREAGNFGWPLFIGNNKPYRDYDYATGTSGPAFDPKSPINDSKNNTGLRELPPAKGAYIYYPYGESPDFEGLGTGGRNAMAGPVYYLDEYSGENTLPAYYDGKVIIYEWMRGWMKAVTLNDDGTIKKYESFAPDVKVNNLIDMETGPDGRIYLLEYGSGWFRQNEDSSFGYLEFNGGNRPPVTEPIMVDKSSGQVPLDVKLSIKANDREMDALNYIWHLGDDVRRETAEPNLTHTFTEEGITEVYVEVMDASGASSTSNKVKIVAGNTEPAVAINIKGGNESFFIPGVPIEYEVSVTDPEDGTAIEPKNIYVSVDYMEGWDEVGLSLGHQEASIKESGMALIAENDCKSCHLINEQSAGPSYLAVSQKYKNDDNAIEYLATKIQQGGSGVWGEVAMAAHPKLTDAQAEAMAVYIKSLAGEINKEPSLPVAGTIVPEAGADKKVMVLTASYTDKGGQSVSSLTGIQTLKLGSSTIDFKGFDMVDGFSAVSFGDMNLLVVPADGGWFAMEGLDMSGIRTINIATGWQEAPSKGIKLDVRIGSSGGPIIGTGEMAPPAKGAPGGMVPIKISKPQNGKIDKLYFTYTPAADDKLGAGDMMALANITFGK